MDIKNIEQALRMHQDFAEQLNVQVAILKTGKSPEIDVLSNDKEQRVAAAKAELARVTRERDEACKQWDDRVMRRKEILTQLEGELSQLKDLATKATKKTKGGTTIAGPKGTPK